jgi:phage baseplate assembly protein W
MANPVQYNGGYDDAQSVNNSPRSTYLYKDLNLFFTPNPVTGDVSSVTDVQAIKRAVRNLVLLNPGEKPFHPEIGTGIRDALFENFTPPFREALRTRIEETIRFFEPRVTVEEVTFNDPDNQRLDNNELRCLIQFSINNAPQNIEEVEVMFKRIR